MIHWLRFVGCGVGFGLRMGGVLYRWSREAGPALLGRGGAVAPRLWMDASSKDGFG